MKVRLKKTYIFFTMFFLISTSIFANEDKGKDTDATSNNETITLPYGFYLGAKFAINQPDKEETFTPFEATASIGFEYEYKALNHFAIQPSFDISFFHYLWTGAIASHSEQENRTAFTIALTAELPLMVIFDIQKWTLSFGPSLAILARGSALDLGVKGDDESGMGLTAREEVKNINKYHWGNGRFFYPAFRIKTEYTLETGWKVGCLFSIYLPIFNLWGKKIAQTTNGKVPFLHDAIFNLSVIIHPGKRK